MWDKYMDVEEGYSAEMWREVINQEALAIRIIPPLEITRMSDSHEIWIPDGKTHVAREVLNKI